MVKYHPRRMIAADVIRGYGGIGSAVAEAPPAADEARRGRRSGRNSASEQRAKNFGHRKPGSASRAIVCIVITKTAAMKETTFVYRTKVVSFN